MLHDEELVYQNKDGLWTQIGQDIYGEAEYDYSGESVSLSSDGYIVAIGAPYNGDNVDNDFCLTFYDYSIASFPPWAHMTISKETYGKFSNII